MRALDPDEMSASVVLIMEEESYPVCIHCLAPLDEQEHFCFHCGSVANGLAELDPIGLIRAEGDLFRRGAERPTKIVLIGFWLLFLPVLVAVTALVSSAGGFYLRSLPATALVLLYSAILYRVTRNYSKLRKQNHRASRLLAAYRLAKRCNP